MVTVEYFHLHFGSLLYKISADVFIVSLFTLSYFALCQCSISCETSPVTKFVKFLNCIFFFADFFFPCFVPLRKKVRTKKKAANTKNY